MYRDAPPSRLSQRFRVVGITTVERRATLWEHFNVVRITTAERRGTLLRLKLAILKASFVSLPFL